MTLKERIYSVYGVNAENATIADILFVAANEFLRDSDNRGYVRHDHYIETYSCCAVDRAIKVLYDVDWDVLDKYPMRKRIMQGLRAMGLDVGSDSVYYKFEDMHGEYATQQARYAWLMFAHDIALEQGV